MKRHAALTATLILLLMSHAAQAQTKAKVPSKLDIGIRAFRGICINSAPGFENAAKFAKHYGVETVIPGIGGMTEDGALSVQIKPGVECAITTASRPGNEVAEQFKSVIATYMGVTVAQFPTPVSYRGVTYIIQHDRNGGEAFVMLRKK